MTVRGICSGCFTEQDVTSAGLIGSHSSPMSMYPCHGARSAPKNGKAWLLCSQCGKQVTEADLKPAAAPKELCYGGDSPKAGCKDCGDIMYMRATGQDERYLAHTYEWWRRQHIDHGTDWAKERMLDYIRDEHQGVLDPKWTGDDKPAVPEARQPEKKVWPVGKTLPAIWAALVCVYGTLWVVDGKYLYLICAVMYAFLVILNYYGARRRRDSARRKLT